MAMRVCILGAGGLGSLVGGMLAESGARVTLVGRPAHVEAIRADGLAVSGLSGERRITRGLEAVASAREARGVFDALILCVKARDSEEALREADHLRAGLGLVFSLQNTVAKDGILAAWIGSECAHECVVGASTTEAATLEGPGRVRHVATAPTAFYFGAYAPAAGAFGVDAPAAGAFGADASAAPAFGAYAPAPSAASGRSVAGSRGAAPATVARVAALVDTFGKAGLSATATDSIRHVEWEKLLQAAVLATWSVSTLGMMPGRSVAEGLVVREAAEHYVAIAKELIGVYRALGYAPQDFFFPYSRFRELASWGFEEAVAGMQAQGQRMLELGATGRPSLHVDLMRGRATEVDQVVTPFLTEADRLGLEVPTTRAAYRIIKTLEQLLA